MKTITEFSGFVLKDAFAKKAALLAEGKSEEEAQAAINEQLKLDEAKAPFYKNVVDMTSSRIDTVKRVVVATRSSETEKVPENFAEREGHFYLVEYFPQAGGRSASAGRDDDFRGGRGRNRNDRGGRGRGEGGRDGARGDAGRGRDSGRPPRGEPRTPPREGAGSFKTDGVPAEGANRRPPRAPRPPRPEGAQAEGARAPRGPRPQRAPRPQQGPKGAGELRLVLKGQTQTSLPTSGGASGAAAGSESSGSSAEGQQA